jgi:DNA-binding LacI/PurR family transcriptional regulator
MIVETTLRGTDKVKHAVYQWIKDNKPCHGDKFPSQNQLAKMLKVSPMTAHKALVELSNNGVLHRIKGRGSFVGSDPKQVVVGLRIAFVVPRSHLEDPARNPNHWHIVQRVSNAAMSSLEDNDSFSTIVINPRNTTNSDITRLSRYDAVIFSGGEEYATLIQQLIDSGVNVIISGAATDDQSNCIKLTQQRTEDVKLGIGYLIEHGYQRIAYIGSTNSLNRFKFLGYKQALKEYGFKFDTRLVVEGIEQQHEGRKGVTILINRQVKFDAIFIDTDIKAVGAIEYLTKTGFKIPDDIGVMGYDGMQQFINAPLYLTTVRSAHGERMKYAINMIRNKQITFDIPSMPGEVIANKTTK